MCKFVVVVDCTDVVQCCQYAWVNSSFDRTLLGLWEKFLANPNPP
ncbi:MAG: hypothetical protein AB1556_12685 [Bacillota bacterium]